MYPRYSCPVPPANWIESPVVDTVDIETIWPLDMSCCTEFDPTSDLHQMAVAAGVESLAAKTCHRYGICELRIRPCYVCPCEIVCPDVCESRYLDVGESVIGPLISVDQIVVDGVAVSLDDYIVRGDRIYPTRDGSLWDCWPGQDNNLPDNDPGTWYIDVTVGEYPPAMLLLAAADLACQLIKTCLDQPCDLPPNAVSVTRDGVTVRLETGFQAIPSVKMALDAYGCKDRPRRSTLIDPSSDLLHNTVVYPVP